jgi:hypothetical protein
LILGWDKGILMYPRASLLVLGLIQPLFSGYWSIFIRLKQLELEVELLHPSSAEVKNEWSLTSTSAYDFMTWGLINLYHFTF